LELTPHGPPHPPARRRHRRSEGAPHIAHPAGDAITPARPVAAGRHRGRTSRPCRSSAKTGVKLWDVATGNQKASLREQKRQGVSLAFSNDGKLLALACADGTVDLWNFPGTEELRR